MTMSEDPFTMEVQLCNDEGIVCRGPMHHGTDYICTGHAHYSGEHIRCSSPAHVKNNKTVVDLRTLHA